MDFRNIEEVKEHARGQGHNVYDYSYVQNGAKKGLIEIYPMEYVFYIDESGTESNNDLIVNERYFVLGAVFLPNEGIKDVQNRCDDIKFKYSIDRETELKFFDMLYGEKNYSNVNKCDTRMMVNEILKVICDMKLPIFYTVVDKQMHRDEYKKNSLKEYDYTVDYLIHAALRCVIGSNSSCRVYVIQDTIGEEREKHIKDRIDHFKDIGCGDDKRFRCDGKCFCGCHGYSNKKSNESIGIQLADMICGAVMCVVGKEHDNGFYNIIKPMTKMINNHSPLFHPNLAKYKQHGAIDDAKKLSVLFGVSICPECGSTNICSRGENVRDVYIVDFYFCENCKYKWK